MAKLIMISYCWNDLAIARPVAQLLKSNGFNVWIDQYDMKVDMNEAMIAAIDNADAILAFISDDYAKSHNCNLEIKYANEKRKMIFPVRLGHSNVVKSCAATFVTAGKIYTDLSPKVWYNDLQRHEQLHSLINSLSSQLELLKNAPINIGSVSPPNPGTATPPLPFSNPQHFIERNEIWRKLDETFNTSKICVLRGVGGSGKTYAACKYAHQRIKSGQNVAWLKSDSAANAESSYREFALAVSRFPANREKLTGLLNLPFNQILTEIVDNAIGSRFFLILDNVDNYRHVELIVSAHASAKCEVLITTRYFLTPTAAINPLESIHVTIPSEQACILFFGSLENRAIPAEDAKEITAACNQLSLRVYVAARYLSSHVYESVESYLKKIEIEKRKQVTDDQIYPEVSLSIDSLFDSDVQSHKLLMLLAFLDPDAIFLNLVQEWSAQIQNNSLISATVYETILNQKNLPNCLYKLENLALITQTFQGRALTIHRCIQADVREKVNLSTSTTLIARNLQKFYNEAAASRKRFDKSLLEHDVVGIAAYFATQTSVDISAQEYGIGDSEAKAIADALKENKSLQSLNIL
ncbi:hypothetical protein HK100_005670, partial [Physocladia obscura]